MTYISNICYNELKTKSRFKYAAVIRLQSKFILKSEILSCVILLLLDVNYASPKSNKDIKAQCVQYVLETSIHI